MKIITNQKASRTSSRTKSDAKPALGGDTAPSTAKSSDAKSQALQSTASTRPVETAAGTSKTSGPQGPLLDLTLDGHRLGLGLTAQSGLATTFLAQAQAVYREEDGGVGLAIHDARLHGAIAGLVLSVINELAVHGSFGPWCEANKIGKTKCYDYMRFERFLRHAAPCHVFARHGFASLPARCFIGIALAKLYTNS